MIISMTGFGRSENSNDGVTVSVELRSVNNRFLEISTRMPRELNARENDIREIVRKVLTRGKIHLNINIERQTEASQAFVVDPEVVRVYKDALDQVRKHAKIKEAVTLSHLLQFSDELLGRNASMTLPLAMDILRGYMGSGNLSVVMAAMSMAVLPVILLFLLAQKFVIEGVTMSGIRG